MTDLLGVICEARQFVTNASELCEAVDHYEKHTDKESLQVYLLGRFNRGKSTIINALLHADVVPMGQFPLTGASIRVTYGETPVTNVVLKNESTQSHAGIEVLGQVAVLSNGMMRSDIEEVIVEFPHPLLKAGLDLIDLPGACDMPERDAFIRRRLFTADLLMHVLDADDQWTLTEDQILKEWVLAQGLRDIVFVVNRANQITKEVDRDDALGAIRKSLTAVLDIPSSPLDLIYRFDAKPAYEAAVRNQPLEGWAKTFSDHLMLWVRRHRPNVQDLRYKKLMRMVAMIHDTLRREIIAKGVLLEGKEDALSALAALCEMLPDEERTTCRPLQCTVLFQEQIRRIARNPFGAKPYDAGRSPW